MQLQVKKRVRRPTEAHNMLTPHGNHPIKPILRVKTDVEQGITKERPRARSVQWPNEDWVAIERPTQSHVGSAASATAFCLSGCCQRLHCMPSGMVDRWKQKPCGGNKRTKNTKSSAWIVKGITVRAAAYTLMSEIVFLQFVHQVCPRLLTERRQNDAKGAALPRVRSAVACRRSRHRSLTPCMRRRGGQASL